MQTSCFRASRTTALAFLGLAGLLCAGASGVLGQPVPPPAPASAPGTNAELLAWDAEFKEYKAKEGETDAKFFFSVTNISSSNVVIDDVTTSCGCTVAKPPSKPWVITPHNDGNIDVTVDLRNKPPGDLFKTVYVQSTNAAKQLRVKVSIPENAQFTRMRNQQMAMADRQGVFRNDCARCHAEPTKGKSGAELYAAACGICHEAEHRATFVPDLHSLRYPTNPEYWKHWITNGRGGSAMPAFTVDQGGPLSHEQIDSLVEYLAKAIPSRTQSAAGVPFQPHPVQAVVNPIPTVATPAKN
jgi:mono/diheme cytochrome c family protein